MAVKFNHRKLTCELSAGITVSFNVIVFKSVFAYFHELFILSLKVDIFKRSKPILMLIALKKPLCGC